MNRSIQYVSCLWLLLSAATTVAADESDGRTLYVNLTSNVARAYELDGVRKLTFSDEELIVQQTGGEQTTVRFDDLLHLTFQPYFSGELTGVEAIPDDKKTISIYPNPVDDELRIEGCEPQNATKIDVFDASGRLVLSSGISVVDVSKLTKGAYFVKIGERAETIKMIKR